MNTAFDSDGFCIVPDVLDDMEVKHLISALDQADISRSMRGTEVFGARNLLQTPEVRAIAEHKPIVALVSEVIGDNAVPVRGLFFDKTLGANWPVAWHQDLTLAVNNRGDLDGWGNWSLKAGVHHVQPPPQILERMVSLRIQLDDCNEDNGPLRVIPGSHRHGRIDRENMSRLRLSTPEIACCCEMGSVVMMRPLLLHASSAAANPNHRRVLHVEFAPADLLPPELRWAEVSG